MFDDRLIRILNKEVAKERLRKQARVRGIIKDKKQTKNNNLILIIKKGEYEEAVLVNKNKPKLFSLAQKLNINDGVYIRGDRKVNIIFCEDLKLVGKFNLKLDMF